MVKSLHREGRKVTTHTHEMEAGMKARSKGGRGEGM
jgi:hypothetical protein